MDTNKVKQIFEQRGYQHKEITPHVLAYGYHRDEILYMIESSAESIDSAGPFDQFGVFVMVKHNGTYAPNLELSTLVSTPEAARDHVKKLEDMYDETEDIESVLMLKKLEVVMS